MQVNPAYSEYQLHFACAQGELGTVKRLIEQSSGDPSQPFLDLAGGSTPLHWAASARAPPIVAYLLRRARPAPNAPPPPPCG